ncbi:MAG: DUF6314 family protein [Kiloniellaceae bacterium]
MIAMDYPGKHFQVRDLKGFLEGTWRLERRIDDRRAGQQGSLSGTAAFPPDGEGLLYREEGRLVIAGHDGPALQSYRYAFPAPQRAAVSFGDGRPFHDLDLTAGAWACVHLCDPDRYEGRFTVLDADSWRVVWKVTGPRKDLVLDSSYRRAL